MCASLLAASSFDCCAWASCAAAWERWSSAERNNPGSLARPPGWLYSSNWKALLPARAESIEQGKTHSERRGAVLQCEVQLLVCSPSVWARPTGMAAPSPPRPLEVRSAPTPAPSSLLDPHNVGKLHGALTCLGCDPCEAPARPPPQPPPTPPPSTHTHTHSYAHTHVTPGTRGHLSAHRHRPPSLERSSYGPAAPTCCCAGAPPPPPPLTPSSCPSVSHRVRASCRAHTPHRHTTLPRLLACGHLMAHCTRRCCTPAFVPSLPPLLLPSSSLPQASHVCPSAAAAHTSAAPQQGVQRQALQAGERPPLPLGTRPKTHTRRSTRELFPAMPTATPPTAPWAERDTGKGQRAAAALNLLLRNKRTRCSMDQAHGTPT